MRASDLPVPLGSLLHGKYRLESVVGGGAMGIVVSAYHVQLERRVALKFLSPEAAENPEAAVRFAREARAATRIQSEHVVRVLDVGETDDATPFMVMEFLEGEDLSDVLRRTGPLPVSTAVDYILQACEALAEAHAAGIVHRDLKPANLFLTHRADGSGLVKICDFGIAKAGINELAKLTFANSFVGSPVYSAPEQIRSASAVDTRADLWALGVILYELLTRETPFNGSTFPELAMRILSDPVPDVRALRSDVPESVSAAIRGCLERDIERRFQNVAVLARELAADAPPSARLSVDRIARVLDLASSSRGHLSSSPFVNDSKPAAVAGTGTRRSAPLIAAEETTPPQALSVGAAQNKRSRVGRAAVALSLVATGAVGAALWLGAGDSRTAKISPNEAESQHSTASAKLRPSTTGLAQTEVVALPAPSVSVALSEVPTSALRPEPSAAVSSSPRPRAPAVRAKPRSQLPAPVAAPAAPEPRGSAASAPPVENPSNTRPTPPKKARNALDMDLK